MYSSMTDIAAPTETVKLNLGGQVGKIKVGVHIPYKKTAAFTSPDLTRVNSKVELYPKGDTLNT